jgi:TonB family protein
MIAMVMLASAAPPPVYPSELYIVRQGISDMMPGWFHYLMIVKPDGRDVVVKLVRVAPLGQVCSNVVTVKSAEARLRDTTVADLIKHNNPCAISADRTRREIDKYSHRAAVDDDAAFGIVAQCSGVQIIHHFPYEAEFVPKKLPPKVQRLRELSWDIQKIAFGDRELFQKTSSEEEEKLQAGGKAMVDELKLGKFDKGFPYKASFVTDLKDYVGIVSAPQQQTGELDDANSYHFQRYVSAVYPPLALHARIQGMVQLDLEVDEATGEVREVSAISGHPLLKPSALEAAKRWKFEPNSVAPNIHVTLTFEPHCPAGDSIR